MSDLCPKCGVSRNTERKKKYKRYLCGTLLVGELATEGIQCLRNQLAAKKEWVAACMESASLASSQISALQATNKQLVEALEAIKDCFWGCGEPKMSESEAIAKVEQALIKELEEKSNG